MAKREYIKPLGRKYYVYRNTRTGQFVRFVKVSRTVKADRRTKARTRVKSGYGHKGDR